MKLAFLSIIVAIMATIAPAHAEVEEFTGCFELLLGNPRVDPTTLCSPNAIFRGPARIGAYSLIRSGEFGGYFSIGQRTQLGKNIVVGENVFIGDRVCVKDGTRIPDGTRVGDGRKAEMVKDKLLITNNPSGHDFVLIDGDCELFETVPKSRVSPDRAGSDVTKVTKHKSHEKTGAVAGSSFQKVSTKKSSEHVDNACSTQSCLRDGICPRGCTAGNLPKTKQNISAAKVPKVSQNKDECVGGKCLKPVA